MVTAIAEGRDCAARVDATLMGTTSLPRAAPLAANPTFYQMPQKARSTLLQVLLRRYGKSCPCMFPVFLLPTAKKGGDVS